MTKRISRLIVCASTVALAAAAPASAQTAPVPVASAPLPAASVQAVSLPTAGAVAALYDQYKLKPVWFKNGAPSVAVTQLTQILRRAPIEGLASGPVLAAQIETAVAQARTGDPAADVVRLGAVRPDDQAADAGHDLRL